MTSSAVRMAKHRTGVFGIKLILVASDYLLFPGLGWQWMGSRKAPMTAAVKR